MSYRLKALLIAACAGLVLQFGPAAAQSQRNLILFVPDGLRALKVTPETAPTMAAVRDKGVNFANPAFAVPDLHHGQCVGPVDRPPARRHRHLLEHHLHRVPVQTAAGSVTPFIENDPILGEIDKHFSGNFVDEDSILYIARHQGFSTAAIGKLGPTLMFDHTERSGELTVTVDDSTGSPAGIPLSPAIKDALTAAGLPLATPGRGDNGKAGDNKTPGTVVANIAQQAYFANVASKVVLPMFKARNKPFVLVLWSRDPDGTQHNQGDSLLSVTPGINGPTSLAAIKNADDNLAELRKALDDLGLAATTDIVIAADHGFSTISKESKTSPAAKAEYKDVPAGLLPPGFVALDLAKALALPLIDPDNKNAAVEPGTYPKRGNGLIGADAGKPDVVVASNGGSDLVYVPSKDLALTTKVVEALLAQDYVSGLFVDSEIGPIPWHAADVRDRYAGLLAHATAVHRHQLPLLLDRLRPARVVHGRSRRHRLAARPGHAWQLQPRRHHEFHGGDRAELQIGLRQRSAGKQCRYRQDHCAYSRPENPVQGFAARPRRGRSTAGRRQPDGRKLDRARPSRRRWSLPPVLVGQRVGTARYFDAAGFEGRTVGLEERKKAASR